MFEQIGISIDAEDRRNVKTQCQDKTVNLYSHIDVAVLAGNCRCYTPQRFISEIKDKNRNKWYDATLYRPLTHSTLYQSNARCCSCVSITHICEFNIHLFGTIVLHMTWRLLAEMLLVKVLVLFSIFCSVMLVEEMFTCWDSRIKLTLQQDCWLQSYQLLQKEGRYIELHKKWRWYQQMYPHYQLGWRTRPQWCCPDKNDYYILSKNLKLE